MTRLRLFADQIAETIAGRSTRWLLPPDPRAYRSEVAWTQWDHADYLFIANLNAENPVGYFAIPAIPDVPAGTPLELVYSSVGDHSEANQWPPWNGKHYRIEGLEPDETRAYRVVWPESS